MSRGLYYIPMLHTEEELGGLKETLTEAHKSLFSAQQTEVLFKEIKEYWRLVAERIEKAAFRERETASPLHIFVDSLPNGTEDLIQKTVQSLIASGKIPAYQIIAKLQADGAKVHGTENLEWLIKEVNYWKAVVGRERLRNPQEEKELLENRDKAIIDRINEVVPQEEIGILFIGRMHNVVKPLTQQPYNFEIIYL
ncbi:MAG: hypothetical protein PHW01_00170 [Patescibacteria group bacterium]|nr:hypothetical protein [Patescibacteria group bacterium]